jgi:serine/threonine protein kinase
MNPTAWIPSSGDLLGRGANIGRFQVIALVGKGGMGEVYAAYDPELDRNVAIKLLRAGKNSGSDEGRARMMREAQAIARVSHPNVVVVYDAGTYQDRVFIAMEFVEGHTLGYWMHARARTWPEVLEVFTAAGRGLAAAHERDLVHRDFKPDNVMIGTDGQVRVMDFGLVQLAGERDGGVGVAARTDEYPLPGAANGDPTDASDATVVASDATGAATDATSTTTGADDLFMTRPLGTTTGSRGIAARSGPRTSTNPSVTRFGATLGTPAYMSPEQFRAEPTDAATDQFSFCVALYEALYGERPFSGRDFEDLGNNVASGFVRTAPKGSHVPFWIREAVLRGLAVKPGDRWPTMNALLTQLEQQPAVESRRRFIAAAAAKLAGIWEVPRGERGADSPTRSEIRRAFLTTGKAYAKKAWINTSQILDRYARRWSDLYVEACEATHVRNEQSTEVLDLRMSCLQEGLEDLKALCRMFRQATPEVVENAVGAANALQGLDRCEDIELLRAVVRPPEDGATRAAVARLRAELAEVRALCRVGRLNDALAAVCPLQHQATAIAYAPLLSDVMIALGTLHYEKGSIADAVRAFEGAVWSALPCRHDEAATEAATFLVYLVGCAQSRFDAAEIWIGLAESLLLRMGGHDLLWGWLLNNRSAVRQTQGRPQDALADARLAAAAKEKVLGADDPDFALSIGNIAFYLESIGDLESAVEHAGRAAQILENRLGPDHPRTAIHQSNFSELLARVGRFEEAADVATRALTVLERETDPDGLYVTFPLLALGASYLGLGRADAALAPLERAHRIRIDQASDPTKRAEARFLLARALWESGRDRARARDLARTARDEYRLPPQTGSTAREAGAIDAWLTTRA